MNFTTTELDLPLFLISRNRYKYQHPDVVRKYIAKKRRLYTPLCNQEREADDRATLSATQKKFQHIVGLDEQPKPACPPVRPLKGSRDLIRAKPWQLPPNRYDILTEPYASHRGEKGAYWAKVPKYKPTTTPKGPKPQWRFYDAQREMERFGNVCNKHKGYLLSNARERKATTRCMVSSLVTCYRHPKEPGATTYNLDSHTIANNVSPEIKWPTPNPHVFLRNSNVPAKMNSIHRKHISFKPGPGRYENRYRDICGCSSKFVYVPGIQLLIEREKRFKFRRLPYTKVRARLYCTPEWRHVVGQGHRRLFKKPKTEPKMKVSKEVKKSDKQYQLYPDSRYIHMINEPQRSMITVWDEYPHEPPPRVVYNCTAKRIVRRQLRNNKKIAFLSGQERFKDAERTTTLTISQLEQIKDSLPLERQLRDHSILHVSPSEIKSKLDDTPAHMLPDFTLRLRKRLFKFLPLPGPKILVTVKDTLPEGKLTKTKAFYGADYDFADFFKHDVAV